MNMQFYLGALVPTGVLTGLFFWLFGARFMPAAVRAPVVRVLASNGGSLIIATVIYAFGAADGGALRFLGGLIGYAPPQLVWLAIGFIYLFATGALTARQNGPR